MNFILNEKHFVKMCLENNTYEKNNIFRTLDRIAQYYYQCCGYRKVKITSLLLAFLEKSYPPYQKNKRQWEKTCERIAKKTGGVPLLEIEGVWLTASELQTIKNIPTKTIARLAFTMACIAKMNNARNPKNNGWLNIDDKSLFDAASVTGTLKQRNLKIAEMLKMGLIEIPTKTEKVNIRCAFLDEESTPKIFVSDFRALGLYYRHEIDNDGAASVCKDCGRHYYAITEDRNPLNPVLSFCPICLKKRNSIKPPILKEKICSDCGISFFVDACANRKIRCDDCQRKHKKEKDRLRKKSKAEFSTIGLPLQTLKV